MLSIRKLGQISKISLRQIRKLLDEEIEVCNLDEEIEVDKLDEEIEVDELDENIEVDK